MLTTTDVARQMAHARTDAHMPEIRIFVDRIVANLTAADPQIWDEYTNALATAMDMPGLTFALYEITEDHRYLPGAPLTIGRHSFDMPTDGYQRGERALADAGYRIVDGFESYVEMGGRHYCALLCS